MLRSVKFAVTVAQADDGAWWVAVDDQHGGKFAETYTQDLETGLRMMVPYMASAAEPDPFTAIVAGLLEPRRGADAPVP